VPQLQIIRPRNDDEEAEIGERNERVRERAEQRRNSYVRLTRVNNAGGCERHKNIVCSGKTAARTTATSNKSPGGRGRAEQIN